MPCVRVCPCSQSRDLIGAIAIRIFSVGPPGVFRHALRSLQRASCGDGSFVCLAKQPLARLGRLHHAARQIRRHMRLIPAIGRLRRVLKDGDRELRASIWR